MSLAIALAVSSALCFGVALVTGRVGLRALDPRSGAAISIPTATVVFVLAAPFALDTEGFSARASLLFALVGLFFPAVVTILTFHSNERLGPSVTGVVSGTAPLFALLAAGVILGEEVPAQAAFAGAAIALGIALLSLKGRITQPRLPGWSLLWPFAGALIRGLAQVGAKAGLLLWPNPFAAGLIGYSVSSITVIGASRLGRRGKPALTKQGMLYFGLTGLLNGAAVLLMYAALNLAPVSLVAPLVATYPLITVIASAALLRDEVITPRMAAGATITVLAVIYLVASTA